MTDPLWELTFENRYANTSLQVPWFSVLGNHDYGGFQCFFDLDTDGFPNAKAQIDYDTEPNWQWPQPKETRWVMPAEYYKKRIVFGNTTIDLFMIDTNFNDNNDGPAACGHGPVLIPPSCDGDQLTGCQAKVKEIQNQVWDFLKKELPASDAKWKLLVGHHPLTYWAGTYPDGNGTHPENGAYQFFLDNGVDAYFGGHMHGMEANFYVPQGDGTFVRNDANTLNQSDTGLFEVVNGAGGGSYPDSGIAGRWGFTGVQLTRDGLRLEYWSENGHATPYDRYVRPNCFMRVPGVNGSCDWDAGEWGACENMRQSRKISCRTGVEEHCALTPMPNSTQACTPAPSPSPAQAISDNMGVIIGAGVAVIAVLALGAGGFMYVRKQRAASPGLLASGNAQATGAV